MLPCHRIAFPKKNELLFFLYVSGPLIQPPIMSKQESRKHTARYRIAILHKKERQFPVYKNIKPAYEALFSKRRLKIWFFYTNYLASPGFWQGYRNSVTQLLWSFKGNSVPQLCCYLGTPYHTVFFLSLSMVLCYLLEHHVCN